ncbi:MAG TPA: hypothetical protein VIX61_08300 [Casimicrobiaceae bacterium]
MSRPIAFLLVLCLAFVTSESFAQAKKGSPSVKVPAAADRAISVSVFMRDTNKNEVLLGTRIWPDYPDYNALVLQRFFAMMTALGPAYKQDDEVAYTWATKGRVAKCSIYLESAEAGAKTGTGAIVGCEANGVSTVPVSSAGDPKLTVSSSQDPKHLNDVMELFKKQSERARSGLPK